LRKEVGNLALDLASAVVQERLTEDAKAASVVDKLLADLDKEAEGSREESTGEEARSKESSRKEGEEVTMGAQTTNHWKARESLSGHSATSELAASLFAAALGLSGSKAASRRS
jgi:hypothetical protein